MDNDTEGLVEVSDYELKETFRVKIRVLIASVTRLIVLYPWLRKKHIILLFKEQATLSFQSVWETYEEENTLTCDDDDDDTYV